MNERCRSERDALCRTRIGVARQLEMSVIRTNGGTQIREQLSDDHVSGLAALYEDGKDIEAILVVLDAEGSHWLVDGFHRRAAQARLGRTTVDARVVAGSLDEAKLLACTMNHDGRQPLTVGDKRRAVLLARSTVVGAKMSERELAEHCGVARSWVHDLLVDNRSEPSDVVEELGDPEPATSRSPLQISDVSNRVSHPLAESRKALRNKPIVTR